MPKADAVEWYLKIVLMSCKKIRKTFSVILASYELTLTLLLVILLLAIVFVDYISIYSPRWTSLTY